MNPKNETAPAIGSPVGGAAAQQSGTTLEVLAPYLPYGIDLHGPFPKSVWPGEARRLLGLSFDQFGGIAETENEDGFRDNTYLFYCLPVLYSFADLPELLVDGEAPALRAFKAALFDEPEVLDWNRAKCELSQPARHTAPDLWVITMFVPIEGLNGGFAMQLANDWTITGLPQVKHRLYLNALLAEHAALGLEPHQYIRKGAAHV